MEARVKEILSWYDSENPGTRTNLARIMNHGRLAGTGRFVILPVDQGFEHGPARSFAVNPGGYDPTYHFQLAIDAGCNAYAAPLGFLEAGAAEFAGEIPLILKMNNHDVLHDEKDPLSAVTASVKDALHLGCVAVVWSYPRGSELSKEGETAVDVVAYATQIAAQLGAHVIKVKPPTKHIEQVEARKAYDKAAVPISTLAERVRHVVQSAFDGKRIVIFSGGATREDDEAFYDECRAIRDGGGFGSIIGRNSFQRQRDRALGFLSTVMKIYAGEIGRASCRERV